MSEPKQLELTITYRYTPELEDYREGDTGPIPTIDEAAELDKADLKNQAVPLDEFIDLDLADVEVKPVTGKE